DRELRPVRRAPERDLVHAERLADGADVVRVVARRVEGARRADLGRALRDERLLTRGRGRGVGLELRAAQDARAPGAARVEGDERVARELVAELPAVRGEVERERGGLARPAGDEEHDPAGRAAGGEPLDVEADRARRRAA